MNCRYISSGLKKAIIWVDLYPAAIITFAEPYISEVVLFLLFINILLSENKLPEKSFNWIFYWKYPNKCHLFSAGLVQPFSMIFTK